MPLNNQINNQINNQLLKPAWLHTNPKIVNGCSTHRKPTLHYKQVNLHYADFVSPCYDEAKEYCIWRCGQNNYNGHKHDFTTPSSKFTIKSLKKYSKYIDTSYSAMANADANANAYADTTGDINTFNDIGMLSDPIHCITPAHNYMHTVQTYSHNSSDIESECDYTI
uniref:Uncharacterized protein n=1 Tax=viral metagenome TaxID=1070528 RepID=A0A6C0HN04_9ZZZZ